MRGVSLRNGDWAPLLEGERWRLLVPIGIFAPGDDPRRLVESKEYRDEMRGSARELIAACVAGLYGYWRTTAGQAVTPTQLPRVAAKVGRNAPCLCGSGKKYKHCCGV